MKTKMNSKWLNGLNLALTAIVMLMGSHAALAQAVPPIQGDTAPGAVSELPPGAPMPGQQVSPDEVAAKSQYCQSQYQWVCNAYGQCMYQIVWMCF